MTKVSVGRGSEVTGRRPSSIKISEDGSFKGTQPELNFTGSVDVTNDPTNNRININVTGGSGSGTVSSFSSGDLSPLFTTSVATATTTPALSFALNTQVANSIFAGPTSGGAVTPTFRTLVAADIPTLSYVSSVNSGNGITVDNTDTVNPIVNLGGVIGSTGAGNITQLAFNTPSSDENYLIIGEISAGAKFLMLESSTGTTGFFLGMAGTPWGSETGIRVPFGTTTYEFIDGRTTPSGIEYNSAGYVTQDGSLTDRRYVLGAKTYSGTQTFLSSGLELNNPANTFQYIFTGAAISADRTVTMPLLAGNDTFVMEAFTQSLTNKTLGSGTKILLGSDATGDIYYNGGSGTVTRLADIATGNVLLSGGVGAAPAYGKVTSSHVDSSIQGSGLSWLLASGGTLTANNTIVTAGFNVSFTGTGKVAFNGTATTAPIIFSPLAADPSVPADMDVWGRDMGAGNRSFRAYENGTIRNFMRGGGFNVNGIVYTTITSGVMTNSANLTFVTNRLIGTTLYLTVSAGTATAGTAPIKMTSGTNLTTAEAGAFEYNGTNLFFTRTGTTRQTVLTANVVTTEVVVSDTTVTVNIAGTDYKLLARA